MGTKPDELTKGEKIAREAQESRARAVKYGAMAARMESASDREGFWVVLAQILEDPAAAKKRFG